MLCCTCETQSAPTIHLDSGQDGPVYSLPAVSASTKNNYPVSSPTTGKVICMDTDSNHISPKYTTYWPNLNVQRSTLIRKDSEYELLLLRWGGV